MLFTYQRVSCIWKKSTVEFPFNEPLPTLKKFPHIDSFLLIKDKVAKYTSINHIGFVPFFLYFSFFSFFWSSIMATLVSWILLKPKPMQNKDSPIAATTTKTAIKRATLESSSAVTTLIALGYHWVQIARKF